MNRTNMKTGKALKLLPGGCRGYWLKCRKVLNTLHLKSTETFRCVVWGTIQRVPAVSSGWIDACLPKQPEVFMVQGTSHRCHWINPPLWHFRTFLGLLLTSELADWQRARCLECLHSSFVGRGGLLCLAAFRTDAVLCRLGASCALVVSWVRQAGGQILHIKAKAWWSHLGSIRRDIRGQKRKVPLMISDAGGGGGRIYWTGAKWPSLSTVDLFRFGLYLGLNTLFSIRRYIVPLFWSPYRKPAWVISWWGP